MHHTPVLKAVIAIFPLLGLSTAYSADSLTRILRYIPERGDSAGLACHALVQSDLDGLPREVINLGELDPLLCQATDSDVEPAITRLALETGMQVRTGDLPAPEIESISEDHLAERILPPVSFGQAAINERRRIIIGAGLNYLEHNEEVGKDDGADASKLLLFAKAIPPTSAYSPIATGVAIGSAPPRPVRLMDYEAEIGFVILEPIDLKAPPSREDLLAASAFFATNDLSDRRPIIIDDEFGYVRGKSHPGYLPVGPWLVPGLELDLASQSRGQKVLEIELKVSAAGTPERQQLRQVSQSRAMLYGPASIVAELSRRYLAGESLCMPGIRGEPRHLHDENGVIPAGSLILTGTPGGTAIKSPGLLSKIRLFLEGGLSVRGARKELIEENEETAIDLGYLAQGDIVETVISSLGRQRWKVVEAELNPDNGVVGRGSCEDFRYD